MTGRVSLGPKKTYLSVLESGFSSSCGGHSIDESIDSLAKSDKGSYLIIHDERLKELSESSKVFRSRV